jgi:hypothetical protein
MSNETATTTATETPAVTAPVKAKPAARKPAAKKAPAKAAPAKKPAANGTAKADSKRVRLFKLLAKYPQLGNAAIREKLGTDSIAATCRDEAVYGRLRAEKLEGETGLRFSLTARGKKALEKGTVDSDKAPAADWPK